MEKILTIGIPVYNMEKYLDRCLSSVTDIRNLDDVEIIVVNDGSKDKSLEIARGYERKFPSSVRVIDKPNGGWGSGINRSISEATGKYYKSLDSDDWFDSANFELYVEELKKTDADMILTPYQEIDENDTLLVNRTYNESLTGKVMNLEDYINENGGFGKTIHSITYRTALLKDNDIRVWDKFYGDLDYINSPLPYVKTIFLSDKNIYRYLIGREGQSISVAGYRKHIDDYLNVCKKLIRINSDLDRNTPKLTKEYLDSDTSNIATFAYKLMLNPKLCGNEEGISNKLKDFDSFLLRQNHKMYSLIPKKTAKRGISPVWIWRKLHINIYKLI